MKTNQYKGFMNVALLPCLLLTLLILPTSCLEDKGNYDYVDLAEFRVDTIGVNQNLTIQQFNTLQVPSHLIYAGNKSDLTYTWKIYKAGGGAQTDNIATLLATTEDLNAPINSKPGTYLLEFVAKNVNTGEITGNRYNLTVESAVGTGLLVLYSKGGKSDIDIIRTPVLNNALTSITLARNFYSNVNSNIVTGEPRQLACNSNYIYIFTDASGIRLSNEDMTQMEDFNGLFFIAPDKQEPMYYSQRGCELLINGGDVHAMITGWDNGQHYFPGPKAMEGDSYYAERAMGVWGNGPFCFDSRGHRFLYCGLWSGVFVPCKDAGLNNITRTITDMVEGFRPSSGGVYVWSFFTDAADNSKRWLMIVDANVNSDTNKLIADVDLSGCPEVSEMQNILTTTNSPMFYYSSVKNTYVCPVSIDEAKAVAPSAPLWTCPSNETITDMQLLNNNSILAVATWNGSEGKIYLFNTDIASGATDSTPLDTFTGFGKIVDMQYKSAQ